MSGGRGASVAAVLVAAMLWGTTGTVQAALPAARDPLAVGALRLAFGAAALVALALADPACRRAARGLPWRGIGFAAIAIAGYNLLFFHAVGAAGVGIGTAVTIGSAPLWTTAWEIASQRRLPGALRAGGQLVSVAGVGLLGLGAGSAMGAGEGAGIAAALGAGACYAAYSLATSRIGARAPSTAIAAATFTLAALLTAPVLALRPPVWIDAPADWALIAYLGVGATGLSYALYTWGLRGVAASTAVTLALAEPVTAWILAGTLVGEPVTWRASLGIGAILAGLAVVALVPARRGP